MSAKVLAASASANNANSRRTKFGPDELAQAPMAFSKTRNSCSAISKTAEGDRRVKRTLDTQAHTRPSCCLAGGLSEMLALTMSEARLQTYFQRSPGCVSRSLSCSPTSEHAQEACCHALCRDRSCLCRSPVSICLQGLSVDGKQLAIVEIGSTTHEHELAERSGQHGAIWRRKSAIVQKSASHCEAAT
jgi:hypothetical protein